MRRRAGNSLGMSLVELMIVVVIIGILAAISVVGYRKYIARARLSEATAMLAEFAAKEQLYFLDNGQFIEAHNSNNLNYPSVNENSSEFWPHDPAVPWDSAREAFSVYDSSTTKLPTSWSRLGVRPRWRQLFCTYLVNAGSPPTSAWPPGPIGASMWTSQPNVPWFYALGACTLNGSGHSATILSLTHDSPSIRTME
jgi:prepilin-type N-terminal cleavage/methylation domain-containing protein